MYSVVKHQALSTTVENKTFSRKKALFRTVISTRFRRINRDVNKKIFVAFKFQNLKVVEMTGIEPATP